MPRTIDLIRASKLPSNMMQFAAKGALQVAPDENIEILVYLAKHNKIFGDTARMTLAGWDEKASLAAAGDPKTSREVLDYLIASENLRPNLLPALLENPSVPDSQIARFAVSASREGIEAMLQSPRVRASAGILEALRANPYLKAEQSSALASLLNVSQPKPPTSDSSSGQLIDEAATDEAVATKSGEPVHDPAPIAGDDVEKFPTKLFLFTLPSTRQRLPPSRTSRSSRSAGSWICWELTISRCRKTKRCRRLAATRTKLRLSLPPPLPQRPRFQNLLPRCMLNLPGVTIRCRRSIALT